MLSAPRLDRPFKLLVDASDVGSGAVLLLVDGAGLRNQSVTSLRILKIKSVIIQLLKRKPWALVTALQHFDVYAGSGSSGLLLITRHLLFCNCCRTQINKRLIRWPLFLQLYPLDIHHISIYIQSGPCTWSHPYNHDISMGWVLGHSIWNPDFGNNQLNLPAHQMRSDWGRQAALVISTFSHITHLSHIWWRKKIRPNAFGQETLHFQD